MNKNVLTQVMSLLLIVVGVLFKQHIILMTGLFAFSGGITNWLAIYMLFEKVPGLYGSGVVPVHFEEFKRGIHHLLMQQFFTLANMERFLKSDTVNIPNIDLDRAFDALVNVIMESSFGSMLGMLGGAARLEGLRDPFKEKISIVMHEMAQEKLNAHATIEALHSKIASVIESRLNELTPELVKHMVEKMIRVHLGWLVVWGGVFGGLIGLVTGILEQLKIIA